MLPGVGQAENRRRPQKKNVEEGTNKSKPSNEERRSQEESKEEMHSTIQDTHVTWVDNEGKGEEKKEERGDIWKQFQPRPTFHLKQEDAPQGHPDTLNMPHGEEQIGPATPGRCSQSSTFPNSSLSDTLTLNNCGFAKPQIVSDKESCDQCAIVLSVTCHDLHTTYTRHESRIRAARRDRLIGLFYAHYALLVRLCLPQSDVKQPPPAGWPQITARNMAGLGKTDFSVDARLPCARRGVLGEEARGDRRVEDIDVPDDDPVEDYYLKSGEMYDAAAMAALAEDGVRKWIYHLHRK
ncbi:uncharacterized protein JN550_005823 [Neoarthrinium moseri]|uniref:uncharacterized protein n=1 Tax=Neoarthrinium moseri TaxID=1658444 RepID=UPI001FDCB8AD|nr:uncharacterized protein JN550_005823 [Neoarthrinium moseri]KAI1869193.1 hypothetical protein JN550_005823 [Neoarthrinium moseri]